MGLDITASRDGNVIQNKRMGTYSYLHLLRKWVYEFLEGNSKESIKEAYDYTNHLSSVDEMICKKFIALCNHSDCDGGYLSYSTFEVAGSGGDMAWGNLDKLREELDELRSKKDMPKEVRECFRRFDSIINTSDEDGDLADIVYFR